MSSEEKEGIVPELRFPEFSECKKWNKEKIGKYLTESRVKGSKGDTARKLTVKLWGNGVYEKDEALKGSANTQYYRRRAGQFIYSKLDFLNQAFGIIPECLDNYESTVDLPCFDIKEGLNAKFLLEYVQRKDFYKKYGEIADGGRKAKRIQVETFFNFPIYLPEFEEQQKIADCLSSIDEMINAQTKKLESIKAHKKGLLQQLFPAEGESLPKLRFAKFKNDGGWSAKTLGEIGQFTGGGTPSKSNTSYWKGTIPWVSSSDIYEESVSEINISRHITQEAIDNSATKLVPEHSILLVSRVGVGKVAFTMKSLCTSQDFINFTPDKDNIIFLAYYLKSQSSRLIAFSQGMAIQGFTKEEIVKFSLYLPPQAEQEEIANCLFSIDEIITAQHHKIDLLKAHKKSLEQKLFPTIDGVKYE